MTLMWLDMHSGGNNIPDRGAIYVIGTAAKALGHVVSSVTLSRISIRHSRCRYHEKRQQWSRISFRILLFSFTGMESFLTLL